jgi:peptidyl-prolyl cis-trans isomerase SurA
MQKRTLLLILISVVSLLAYTQEDQTLFTVADVQVPVSEFRYIYTKNNRDNADYSRASVTEYLDLYTRFKLKVKRARDLELDTISALQQELAGYRAQLAKSYLNDKEVIDKLTLEAFERMQWDLHVAHILFKLDPNAPPEDQARVLDGAIHAANRAAKGENFAKLALELSEDPGTKRKGGDLGYVTCLLPNGFYAAENAIYGLENGKTSAPVRSPLGYHVFKVLDRRPARGEIEAAHIFVRVKADSSNAATASQKIHALRQNLENDVSFDELARTVSDDQQTARRGGYIGRFGINSYDPEFEEAAFSLTTPGSFSNPVRTRVGWHIIKLINRFELGSYEDEQNRLEARIAKDERVNAAKKAMIETIKAESGLKENAAASDAYIKALKEDFLTFQWTVPETNETLISFADGSVKTTTDFVTYLKTKTRERMRAAKSETPQSIATALYQTWVDDLCLEYDEARLEDM